MHRIFGKLYTIKWPELLKSITKKHSNVKIVRHSSICLSSTKNTLSLLSSQGLGIRPKIEFMCKRLYCRRYLKEKKLNKLEGAAKLKKEDKLSNTKLANLQQYASQITWKAMLKKNDKPKKKSKAKEIPTIEAAAKKTQSEHNIKENNKNPVKTLSQPQVNSPKIQIEKMPITMSSHVMKNLSKIPRSINIRKDKIRLSKDSIENDPSVIPKVLKVDEKPKIKDARILTENVKSQIPTNYIPANQSENGPRITTVADEFRRVKFNFVAMDRPDIPPPKDMFLLKELELQSITPPSKVEEVINTHRINIKNNTPKTTGVVGKNFKVNPLIKPKDNCSFNSENTNKHLLFNHIKSMHVPSVQPEIVVTPHEHTIGFKMKVPPISKTSKELIQSTMMLDESNHKQGQTVNENSSSTILAKPKFPDKTPRISPPPNQPSVNPKLKFMPVKTGTFTIETKKGTEDSKPVKVSKDGQEIKPREKRSISVSTFEMFRGLNHPKDIPIFNSHTNLPKSQTIDCENELPKQLPQPFPYEGLNEMVNSSGKSKLPRLIPTSKNLKECDDQSQQPNELTTMDDALPKIIEPPKEMNATEWKLTSSPNRRTILSTKKKPASKIPIRDINEHPLLLSRRRNEKNKNCDASNVKDVE